MRNNTFFSIKFFFMLVFFCSGVFANEYYVRKVIDADTIQVAKNGKKIKVRFYGIDAPESGQRYGKYCTKELKNLIDKKYVKLDIKTTDTYGRKVAIIYHNGIDINQKIVRLGCAWAYVYYTSKYKQDEKYAKDKKLGLWKDKNPQNPYNYRKKQRK